MRREERRRGTKRSGSKQMGLAALALLLGGAAIAQAAEERVYQAEEITV